MTPHFSLEPIDENVSIYSDITISDVENELSTIDEIAISENGMVALRFNNKAVNVYDAKLNHCYSFYFDRSHCSTYLEWEHEILHVYVGSLAYQYDIQLLDGVPTVYSIVDSEQSDEMWERLYHSSGGAMQSVTDGQYTYFRTRTRCWRYDKTTKETEMIADVIRAALKHYLLPSLPILFIVCIMILTKIKDASARRKMTTEVEEK